MRLKVHLFPLWCVSGYNASLRARELVMLLVESESVHLWENRGFAYAQYIRGHKTNTITIV